MKTRSILFGLVLLAILTARCTEEQVIPTSDSQSDVTNVLKTKHDTAK